MFERLKDLSAQEKDSFFRSPVTRDSYRYHEIDWSSIGIPIKREDLTWIHKDILSNEEEFPFFQFHISKAVGRIVGFWNPGASIFFIVLLDPMHTIQPSKFTSYKTRDADPLKCEYSSLLADIQEVKSSNCSDLECKIKKEIQEIPTKQQTTNTFIFHLDDEYTELLKKLLNSRELVEVVKDGIINSLE